MVLLIDNYDSFTYNLYDLIKQLGKDCIVIRNDEKSIKEISQLHFDSIVLSPGPGIPKDAGITMAILKKFAKTKPILGICLGHQAIGEYFGAKLTKAKLPVHGKTSTLYFREHLLFSYIEEPFEVMRYHSLILNDIQTPLETIATTINKEIMAISHKDLPIIGIQYHPESILTENGLKIISNFFELIAK